MSIYGPGLDDDSGASEANTGGDVSFFGKRIIEVGDPKLGADAATKEYVDNLIRRVNYKYITVWAESPGPLSDGNYEFAFGGRVRNGRQCGYTMLAPGYIQRMGLTGGSTNSDSIVYVSIDGVVMDEQSSRAYSIYKPKDQRSAVINFDRPLYVDQGAVINFVTGPTKRSNAQATVVSILIQIHI